MVSFKVGRGERFFQMFLRSVSLFLYISMFIAHLVAYLSSLLELPRRDRTGHDHQGRQSTEIPFFFFIPIPQEGGRGGQNPDRKFVTFSPILIFVICTWNYMRVLRKLWVWNVFKLRRQTLTQAVFTYSHLNWSVDLWEQANYLSYIITVGSFVFDHANHTR